jgi:SSS family solute:Na+ symporter
MYLGAVCIKAVFGVPLHVAIISIAFFSAIYTILGGLKAIAYTDFIQVTFLVTGGLITVYLALDKFSGGAGIGDGLIQLFNTVPEKFDLILDSSSPFYANLPGWHMIFGAMWIINLNYWGCNQYITQRALAAKSLDEAQKGLIFAGFLKLLMPLIVVLPGIIAFALAAPIQARDETYPWLLNTFLFPGVKGIAFAALVAAVVGSLSSKTNSIATIFTMDIYKPFFGENKSDKHLVLVGRITTAVALIVAVMIAPYIENFGGGFQFIQEFTGFFSPGIFAIFIFGLFWKKATANAAFWVAILTLPTSLLFYFVPFLYEIPFIIRMGYVFAILSTVLVVLSLREGKESDDKAIIITRDLFKTTPTFNIAAGIIVILLTIIYYTFA